MRTACLDQHRAQRNFGPTVPVGQVAQEKRAATRDVAKALNKSQTGFQLRWADSKELKAIIVPKPMLLSAEPNPGIHTALATLRKWDRGLTPVSWRVASLGSE